MLTVTGSPIGAFTDAVLARLTSDASVMGLLTGGVFTSLPVRSRTTTPYAVLSRQSVGVSDAAMQREGGQVSVTLDVWSALNGPHETVTILSRARALLQRCDLAISGYTLTAGSVTCEEELVFADVDPDMPERQLFHGVQRWIAWVEESI